MSKKICLDAGHGYETAGKRTPVFTEGMYIGEEIREAEQNYPVMEKAGEYLKYNGFEVIYTNRNIQFDKDLEDRVAYANEEQADIFISIHKNAFTGEWDAGAKGIETYHYPGSTSGNELATVVQNSLISDTGMNDRGVKTNDELIVLKNTTMPAILTELGFMDYYDEAMQMRDEEWQNKFAKAITKAVGEFFGVDVTFPAEHTLVTNDGRYDVNLITESGFYCAGTGAVNLPKTGQLIHVAHDKYPDRWGNQLLFNTSSDFYIRGRDGNGVWGEWKKIITTTDF